MSSSNKSHRKIIWTLVRFAVSVGLLAFVVSQITWQDRIILGTDAEPNVIWGRIVEQGGRQVMHSTDGETIPVPADLDSSKVVYGFWTLLRSIDVRYLGLALLVYPVMVLLTVVRWQWLLQTHGLDPGFLEATRLTWMGLLANNVLPGNTGGDVFKGWCIYRRTPGKRLNAVMTVLLDRVLGLVSMMMVGGVALLVAADHPEIRQVSRHIPLVLFVVLVGGIIFFSGRIRRLLRISEIIERFPFNQQIKQVDQSVFHFRQHVGTLAKAVAISLPVHLGTFACVWLLGLSLGLDVAPINYFAFLPVILTFGAVIPAIGGLGVLETLFAWCFSLPGVGATASGAVALCIVFRFLIFTTSLPGAIPLYREFSTHGIPKTGEDSNTNHTEPITDLEDGSNPVVQCTAS